MRATEFNMLVSMIIEEFEGGYGTAYRTQYDKGELTRAGLTQGLLQEYYSINSSFPVEEINSLTETEILKIYYDVFWQKKGWESTIGYPPLKLLLLDSLIQHGEKNAIIMFQHAMIRSAANNSNFSLIRLKVDGIFGSKTAFYLNRLRMETPNIEKFIMPHLISLRGDFYVRLAEKDSTQLGFLTGWFRRLHRINNWFIGFEIKQGKHYEW